MFIIGIIICFLSILLIIFPKFFLNLKSPDTAFIKMKGLQNNKKVIIAVRVWGVICFIISIVLLILSFK